VNYYDNSLSIVGTGTGATIDQAAGTVTLSGNMQTSGQGVYNTEYNKVNILTNGANEVFVKYEVSQDVLKNMLNGDIKLAANVVEINSTTAKKDNKGYTAIDTDSAVGNAATQKTTIHNRRSRFEKNPLPFLFFFLLISTPISGEEAVR